MSNIRNGCIAVQNKAYSSINLVGFHASNKWMISPFKILNHNISPLLLRLVVQCLERQYSYCIIIKELWNIPFLVWIAVLAAFDTDTSEAELASARMLPLSDTGHGMSPPRSVHRLSSRSFWREFSILGSAYFPLCAEIKSYFSCLIGKSAVSDKNDRLSLFCLNCVFLSSVWFNKF